MYDLILLEDLKNFKTGAGNIYELQNRYRDIIKIIKNRTREKINFLQYVLEQNIIDINLYNELLDIVRSDYNNSFLYIHGWETI